MQIYDFIKFFFMQKYQSFEIPSSRCFVSCWAFASSKSSNSMLYHLINNIFFLLLISFRLKQLYKWQNSLTRTYKRTNDVSTVSYHRSMTQKVALNLLILTSLSLTLSLSLYSYGNWYWNENEVSSSSSCCFILCFLHSFCFLTLCVTFLSSPYHLPTLNLLVKFWICLDKFKSQLIQ